MRTVIWRATRWRRTGSVSVAQVLQGALEVEAHHRLVTYGVGGVQADEEVVDAKFGERIDSLGQHAVAVGVEAQLGLGQALVNHLEPRQDLGVGERIALQEGLDGPKGKLAALLDDAFEQLVRHVPLAALERVVRAEDALGATKTGGLDGDEPGKKCGVHRCHWMPVSPDGFDRNDLATVFPRIAARRETDGNQSHEPWRAKGWIVQP
jgi:hypothetical protein